MSNQFEDVFEVELKCWCHGLSTVEGRVDRQALNEVIKELAPVFTEAIEHNYVFDARATAKRLLDAAKCPELEKEITFYILSLLPFPAALSASQAETLQEIVLQVESHFSGALARLQRKWESKARASSSARPKPRVPSTTSFDSLSFPKSKSAV